MFFQRKLGELMAKKRFLLAIVLVVILALYASSAFAGCCVGVTSCSRAFFESEC
jgi:hypothetical protein